MKYPLEIEKNGRKYYLLEEHKRFGIYEYETEHGKTFKECFDLFDVGQIEETEKVGYNIRPENVIYI